MLNVETKQVYTKNTSELSKTHKENTLIYVQCKMQKQNSEASQTVEIRQRTFVFVIVKE